MASASTEATARPPVVVVMGVSGSGKSTMARLLAGALGVDFAEGDDFHSAANVAKMRSGTPLSDADRQTWLEILARRMGEARRRGAGLVLSCSALKRSYRDLLRAAVPDMQLVHLRGDFETVQSRLAARTAHYMPSSLLQSQFADLEVPGHDEGVHEFTILQSPRQIAEAFCNQLAATT